ncbi:MAG: hypothetical protein GYB68_10195 [Chloroflexi bacterium]|nr:hypothetical protein [Chloroflexota bacterium]
MTDAALNLRLGPPDLTLEVISPSERAAAVDDKIAPYIDAGAQEVWVMYPTKRRIHIYPADQVLCFSIDDELTGSSVLPGFSTPMQHIFRRSLKSDE